MSPSEVARLRPRGRKRAPKPVEVAGGPPDATLAEVREVARGCRACELWKLGTQTVFGEGPPHADLILVGEQPGDREDRAGHPFVGPAGRLLDEALREAGIERGDVYLTNAVKHFKWEPRGKARIHKKPSGKEVAACRPWLEREIELVRPTGLLCLGATAAQALLGSAIRVTVSRGRALDSTLAPLVMVTVHPSSLLRAPTEEDRARERARFVEDLKAFRSAAAKLHGDRRTRARA